MAGTTVLGLNQDRIEAAEVKKFEFRFCAMSEDTFAIVSAAGGEGSVVR